MDAEHAAAVHVDRRRLRQYDSCNVLTSADEESDLGTADACRCTKDDHKRVAVRKYAGVFVVLLPSEHVVFLHHIVGSESLPQVACSFAKARDLLLPSKSYMG
eukprot:s418_g4.t1